VGCTAGRVDDALHDESRAAKRVAAAVVKIYYMRSVVVVVGVLAVGAVVLIG